MSSFRRRAIWVAAAVSVLAFAWGGAFVANPDGATADPGRATVHHVVDHDAVVSVRPQAARPLPDLQPEQSRLLLLAWVSVLLGAGLLARAAGRTLELVARRAGSTLSTRQRFDRGPPALAFA